MRMTAAIALMVLGIMAATLPVSAQVGDQTWLRLFDGQSLDGWKASENKGTFTVENGALVAHGARSHLFYVGPVAGTNFKNFEFKADVMTTPGSNSGIYYHTEYQQTGWPAKGYEFQVNSTDDDPIRTASIYGVEKIA